MSARSGGNVRPFLPERAAAFFERATAKMRAFASKKQQYG